MFHPQQPIGPYTLIRLLGRGGFGEVWLAEKRGTMLTPQVALKLPLDPDPDLDAVQREARVWLQASGHPNILPVLDAEVYEGQVVIVSEYAAGGSLSSWLKQHGGKAPSVEAAVAMTSGILAGLEHLHHLATPIIHRDLKPDNVLLQGNLPRVTDFGISRVLKTTDQTKYAAGTPHYMPPEAFEGRYSPQSDVWAVGVMLYQMLSGNLPFPQSDMPSLYGAILTSNPAPLPADVPDTLRNAVMSALEKAPTRRLQSAPAMRALLNQPLSPSVPSNRIKTNPIDGAEMVWVPAGTFQMGSDNGRENEKPVHSVTLSGFWMYKTLVTVAQFRKYDTATGRNYNWRKNKPDWGWRDDHPMITVSWMEASAYAKWAGGALPTEAQWEYAARGGLEGRNYPWGDSFNRSRLRCSDKDWADAKSTAAVASYPANGYGLYDMAGNVWQWCADWYDENYYKTEAADSSNPTGPASGKSRATRGGSWLLCFEGYYRCAGRSYENPVPGDVSVGFRCCSSG